MCQLPVKVAVRLMPDSDSDTDLDRGNCLHTHTNARSE